MKSDTVWQICVFTLVLLTHFSQASNACSKELTDMARIPVIHMCTNEVISNITQLYLDGFVPKDARNTCNCSLQATHEIKIGVNMATFPDKNCTSTFTVNTTKTTIYNCLPEKWLNVTIEHKINQARISIQLEANMLSPRDVTYCLNIYKIAGEGTLTLQCYSPFGSSISSSTSKDKAILLTSTTPSSSSTKSTKADSPPVEPTTSTITDTTVYGQTTNRQSGVDDFPVPAVAGGVGAVVIIVIAIIVVVLVKRRRNKKHGLNSDDEGGYCNMDSDPYKNQNTKSSGRHSGVSSDQNQTGNQTTCSPSDDYASIDDGAGDITYKPQVALKPKPPSTRNHGDLQPQPDHDHVSSMYAKVNKNKKPTKSVNEAAMPVMHVNELYAVVDKPKKGKQPLKAKPSGELYAVVNKKKKSGGTGSECKGQGPESEVIGDVYTEVRKTKKSANNPITPKGSPGLIYTELEFDENQDEPKGATGGNEKTDSVATEEDSVLYSKVC